MSSRLRGLCGRRDGKTVGARGDRTPRKTMSSRHNSTEALSMNSETVATHTGPARVQTISGPSTERVKWT